MYDSLATPYSHQTPCICPHWHRHSQPHTNPSILQIQSIKISAKYSPALMRQHKKTYQFHPRIWKTAQNQFTGSKAIMMNRLVSIKKLVHLRKSAKRSIIFASVLPPCDIQNNLVQIKYLEEPQINGVQKLAGYGKKRPPRCLSSQSLHSE